MLQVFRNSIVLFVSTLWPMVPLCVKPQVVGTAYGVCNVFQNLGLALGPIMVGALTFKHNNENRYVWVNVSLGVVWFFAFLSAVGIWIADKYQSDGLLQKPRKANGQDHIDILTSPIAGKKSTNLAFYNNYKVYLEGKILIIFFYILIYSIIYIFLLHSFKKI